MKNSIFWDNTPYSPLKINQFFEEHIAFITGVAITQHERGLHSTSFALVPR
jgi:hypothetical protein